MKKKVLCILTMATIVIQVMLISAAKAGKAYYFRTIDFAYNCELEVGVRPSISWPQGVVELGGILFNIPLVGPDCWNSHDPWETGPNPRTLDIQVNEYGVEKVYTLINTHGGQTGSALAWLEFYGDGGAYFQKDLIGNVDIRDYNYDGWTNDINGTTTVNVFLVNPGVWDGETRLDMQMIDLPKDFRNQTLTNIRLTDNGGTDIQRVFLTGVTLGIPTTKSLRKIELNPNIYIGAGGARGTALAEYDGNGTLVTIEAKNLPILDNLPLTRTGNKPNVYRAYVFPLVEYDYGYGYPKNRSSAVFWKYDTMTEPLTPKENWTTSIYINDGKPSQILGVYVVAADSTDPDNHVDLKMVVLSQTLGMNLRLEP